MYAGNTFFYKIKPNNMTLVLLFEARLYPPQQNKQPKKHPEMQRNYSYVAIVT